MGHRTLTIEHWQHLGLLCLEAALVAGLIITLYRAKRVLGLGVLFIALGSFQYLQVVSALSLYVEIAPGLVVSPGSVVLFSASMVAVLLVYILEDAQQTRRLVYGLIYANIVVSAVSFLFGLHLKIPKSFNLHNIPESFFMQDARVLLVGTAALFLDVLLVVVVYEWLSRRLSNLFVRVAGALIAALTVDTILFVSGAFFERDDYINLIISGIVGKLIAASAYALILTGFLRRRVVVDRLRPTARLPFARLFSSVAFSRRMEELERQEFLFDDASKGANVAVCEIDLRAAVVRHGPRFAELLGLDPEARGTLLSDIFERIGPTAASSFHAAVSPPIGVTTPDAMFSWEFSLSDDQNDALRGQLSRWFVLRGRPRDNGDTLTAVLLDFSNRKAMEHLTGRFLAMAGHELRTPLTSTYASLRLATSGKLGELSPPLRSILSVAERNAERLTRLINDLLDFDRLQQGGMPLRQEYVVAHKLVEQVIVDLQSYIQMFKVEVGAECPEEISLTADPDRLHQILSNLISNAVKHASSGVVVRVAQRPQTVRFEVLDDGGPVPEELVPRLFEAFAGSASSPKDPVKSTGLGLAITKSLVEAHGGTLGFSPATRHSPKMFYFELPTARTTDASRGDG